MTSGPDGCEKALVGRGGIPLWVRRDVPPGEPGATLVLVHGWGEHQGRYRELAGRMTEWGLSVWGFDLRGHGKSGGRRGHVDRFGDFLHDLIQVVDHARGVETDGQPLLLLGHSLGGLILLRALQKRALRPSAACVSAPWLKTAVPVPAWKTALAASLERIVPALPVPNRLNPELLTADPVKIRQHRDDPLIHGWMTPRCFGEVQRAQSRALGETESLDLPILFMIPGDDPVVDPEVTADFARRTGGTAARVVEVPGSRHEPFNEVDRMARFDEVGRFFSGVLGPDRQDMDETEMNSEDEHTSVSVDGVTEEQLPSEPGQESEEGESPEAAGEDSGGPDLLDDVRLAELTAERDQLRDKHLRLAADFDNYRKRVEADLRGRWDRAQAELVGKLLEPLDDLQRVAAWEPETTSVDAIIEGVDLVERKFVHVIEEVGIEMINPAGERFDPNTMEAMMRVPTDSQDQDDMVEKVFQKGCTLKGQLVRPARVSVFKAE